MCKRVKNDVFIGALYENKLYDKLSKKKKKDIYEAHPWS